MWSRSTKQRRSAMRRREGLVRTGEHWYAKHPPTEWVPLSERYPEFFPKARQTRIEVRQSWGCEIVSVDDPAPPKPPADAASQPPDA